MGGFTNHIWTQKKPISWKDLAYSINQTINSDYFKEHVEEETGKNYEEVCKEIFEEARSKKENILGNINALNTDIKYSKLILEVLSDLRNHYSNIRPPLPKEYLDSFDKPPKRLYKYVSKRHACENVQSGVFSCGTMIEYRKDDEDECNPAKWKDSQNSFLDRVFAEVIMNTLTPVIGDFHKVIEKMDNTLDERFLIGCFSDKANDEELWRIRACNDGVCIEIDPYHDSGFHFYKVLYADYLTDFSIVKTEFEEFSNSLSRSVIDDVNRQYKGLLQKWISLSTLAIYCKNQCWSFESEWRVVMPPIPKKRGAYLHKIPHITSIEGRLPDGEASRMETICSDLKIPFHNSESR